METSRIKLSNRDSAVWTPDESGWFRVLKFSFTVRTRRFEEACRWAHGKLPVGGPSDPEPVCIVRL